MDLDKIKEWCPTVEQCFTARDAILYALGLGYGSDPTDMRGLPFVYEGTGLKIVPSMCMVLAQNKFWLSNPIYGVDVVKLLHAEQSFTIHQPIAEPGPVRAIFRVSAIEDKGAERGALLHQEKELFNASTGAPISTLRYTLFLRGNGGEGGFGDPVQGPTPLPERQPDLALDLPTSRRAALLYRLSGDYNPLHADPDVARRAGFDQPILHGLCTMGVACRALLKAYCGDEPAQLRSMFVRFTAPVFPGETIRVETFEEPGQIRFRASAVERGVIVLDRGTAQLA